MTTGLLLLITALFSRLDPALAAALHEEPAVVEQAPSDPVASVQVELLPDQEGAERLAASLRERLDAAGLDHEVFVEAVPGEPELPISYRVGVGPFSLFEDAERARVELEDLGVDAFVREFEEPIGC